MWHHCWIEAIKVLGLRRVLPLREVNVVTDALAKESYAKKIRTTPWIKNCVWELSNLTWAYIVIKVLKLVTEPTLDQESEKAPLEGEHMKKEV